MEKFSCRFDKKFNPQVLTDHNMTLVNRSGLVVTIKGTFWDFLQLKNYPFIKDMGRG